MKISIAQIRPYSGKVDKNIELHLALVNLAINHKTDAVFFPELSLTGYEPELADRLKMEVSDKRLEVFQQLSDKSNITIGLGAPTIFRQGVQISMLIFQPNQPRKKYAKQMLDKDELPYFLPGEAQIIIEIKEDKIAPAICYESLQVEHFNRAMEIGANIYLASVAKSQQGMNKATNYFPKIAKENSIPVFLSNCVGYCDNFLSVGQSAIWNDEGVLVGQISKDEEGLLIYDTKVRTVKKVKNKAKTY